MFVFVCTCLQMHVKVSPALVEPCRPVKKESRMEAEKAQTQWAKLPGGGRVDSGYTLSLLSLRISGGLEATWPKWVAAVINSPCLGHRHRYETDEASGWWMRAAARADKTWPMNLFYIIGSFDHWQKFRDGPVHLSKQTKASFLPKTFSTPQHSYHLLFHSFNNLPLRLALTFKQWRDKKGWQRGYACVSKMES